MAEIVRKYPVDAIHFDDYFYLYDDIGNVDADTFRRHNPRRLNLGDWRRDNVTRAIVAVRQVLDAHRRSGHRKVELGISPFGILANRKSLSAGSLTGGKQTYFIQFADTRLWVKRGLIDYIAPQLYWTFSHPVAAYAALVDFWSRTVTGTPVKLYIGLAPYRLGSPGWREHEVANQLRYNQWHPNIKGAVTVLLPASVFSEQTRPKSSESVCAEKTIGTTHGFASAAHPVNGEV